MLLNSKWTFLWGIFIFCVDVINTFSEDSTTSSKQPLSFWITWQPSTEILLTFLHSCLKHPSPKYVVRFCCTQLLRVKTFKERRWETEPWTSLQHSSCSVILSMSMCFPSQLCPLVSRGKTSFLPILGSWKTWSEFHQAKKMHWPHVLFPGQTVLYTNIVLAKTGPVYSLNVLSCFDMERNSRAEYSAVPSSFVFDAFENCKINLSWWCLWRLMWAGKWSNTFIFALFL